MMDLKQQTMALGLQTMALGLQMMALGWKMMAMGLQPARSAGKGRTEVAQHLQLV
jgi:hypothetical protein